jgi:hypothetical protein
MTLPTPRGAYVGAYVSASGMEWMSGRTKRHCDRALPTSRRAVEALVEASLVATTEREEISLSQKATTDTQIQWLADPAGPTLSRRGV